MVSAQLIGTYYIDIRNPAGHRERVFSPSSVAAGPGGSSDGAIASSSTPDTWITPNLSPVVGGPGYDIIVGIISSIADTTDASDSVWSLPFVVNGNPTMLGNSASNGLGSTQFVVDQAFGDVLLTVNQERDLAIYRAKEGVFFRFGGNKIFLTMENDA